MRAFIAPKHPIQAPCSALKPLTNKEYCVFKIRHQQKMGGDKVFVTGSKTFEITDFSIIHKAIANGSCIQSDAFTVGDHQWAIKFYPHGFNSSHTDSISIMIKQLNPTKDAKAFYAIHLKDWEKSTWSADTPTSYDVRTYSPSCNSSWGWFDYMKQSKLKTSPYLKNNKLMIKATLWVVKD